MLNGANEILHLGRQQAQLFTDNNVAYCEVLVTANCPRTILLMAYYRLVKERKLIAIEELPIQQKETAWQMAKDIAQGRLGRKLLIEVVQSLLALEYFLNL
jgi:hypothetical protein